MKIALIGYGKMGKTIEYLIKTEFPSFEVCKIIDKANQQDIHNLKEEHCDVAIEFSNPESAYNNIEACLSQQIPVVSGTTGWLDKYEKIEQICASNESAFFYASNFSIGMNIFMHLNKQLANLMDLQNDYELSMDEIHHIHKLDAPSGTAISLSEDIIGQTVRFNSWSLGDRASSDQIPILSKREGEVPGTHIIKYESPVDRIEFKHEAKNRHGFAKGAILAAKWLVGKKGVFGMNDMLNLKQ